MKTLSTKRVGALAVLTAAIAGGAAAYAAVPDASGVIHGCYAKRDGTLRVIDSAASCSSKTESPLNWSQTGPQGPQGVPGPPGPKGDPGVTSLSGMSCDTGDVEKPNAAISYSVDGSGTVTLKCLSQNPKLGVGASPPPWAPTGCLPVLPCYSHYQVVEVDGGGSPVADGFTCLALSGSSTTCLTQRFASGDSVHLATADVENGYMPSWTGCDSVSGGICTVQVTGDEVVAVSMVATS